MNSPDRRAFHDEPADRYHLLYADRDAGIARRGRALDALLTASPGPGPHRVLDNACGIGTRVLGLAAQAVRAALAETPRVLSAGRPA
ncbi:hypothetical protein [Streptomyces sp. NPDC059389]|uniref:hypothetical protein n=1 Tax=Streptomyces sp. NPDC059389 TaxID=3346818 RepID=UPI0036C52C1E